MSIKSVVPKSFTVKAGQVYQLTPAQPGTNVVQILVLGSVDVYVADWSDVSSSKYEVRAKPKIVANFIRGKPITSLYFYAASDCEVFVQEMETDGTQIVFTQSTSVTEVTGGQVTPQVGGADVAPDNPLPVEPGTGAIWDVSDRATREVGKVYAGGWTAARITAAGAGEVVVKAGAGQLARVNPLGGISVTPRNGTGTANDVWEAISADTEFHHPIQCGTEIRLHFSAAGDCWVIYR